MEKRGLFADTDKFFSGFNEASSCMREPLTQVLLASLTLKMTRNFCLVVLNLSQVYTCRILCLTCKVKRNLFSIHVILPML